ISLFAQGQELLQFIIANGIKIPDNARDTLIAGGKLVATLQTLSPDQLVAIDGIVPAMKGVIASAKPLLTLIQTQLDQGTIDFTVPPVSKALDLLLKTASDNIAVLAGLIEMPT